jgi:hypothetical protein
MAQLLVGFHVAQNSAGTMGIGMRAWAGFAPDTDRCCQLPCPECWRMFAWLKYALYGDALTQ